MTSLEHELGFLYHTKRASFKRWPCQINTKEGWEDELGKIKKRKFSGFALTNEYIRQDMAESTGTLRT